jgi:hypothetical protein
MVNAAGIFAGAVGATFVLGPIAEAVAALYSMGSAVTELNQDDFMNKNRKLARDLRQLGIDLK